MLKWHCTLGKSQCMLRLDIGKDLVHTECSMRLGLYIDFQERNQHWIYSSSHTDKLEMYL